ncbi:MAG: DUF4124 domain-containing protein [Betaproteobacteria bacterium]|nr:DUF4124 domain-containing protein [Betaproteobacteria bacterium]
MKFLVLALAVALAVPVHAAMYKWVDAQGRVQYSDIPPPPNARNAEEQKIVPNTIQTTGAPFAVQEAAKRNPVTVWMSDCGDLCNRARDYLARRGVPHTVRNPSRQSEQEAWKQVSGGDNSVPLLVIGTNQKLKGFDESQWNAALDTAGYPRNAPALEPHAIPSVEAPVVVKPAAGAGAPPPAQGAQAAGPAK